MKNREMWKPILNYEGLYEASNFGNIRSLDRIVVGSDGVKQCFRGKILKPTTRGYGNYRIVKLSKGNIFSSLKVSRLVWEAFNGKTQIDLVIDHIDGNKNNDSLNNLQPLSSSDNIAKGYIMKGRELPTGVYKHGKKYRVSIQYKRKKTNLGTYSSIDEASSVYQKTKKELYKWNNFSQA